MAMSLTEHSVGKRNHVKVNAPYEQLPITFQNGILVRTKKNSGADSNGSLKRLKIHLALFRIIVTWAASAQP